MKGFLTVITGCMFSGKSDEFIRRLNRAIIAKKSVVHFKPQIDTRYSVGKATSHSNNELAGAIVIKETKPRLILSQVFEQTQVVGIDEVQFFAPDILDVCKILVDQGKYVIVAGLKQDFRGEPFGPMPQLLTEADFITCLNAICMVCGEDNATMTQRLINGKPAPYSGEQVLVGGTDSYEARCRTHHIVPGKK